MDTIPSDDELRRLAEAVGSAFDHERVVEAERGEFDRSKMREAQTLVLSALTAFEEAATAEVVLSLLDRLREAEASLIALAIDVSNQTEKKGRGSATGGVRVRTEPPSPLTTPPVVPAVCPTCDGRSETTARDPSTDAIVVTWRCPDCNRAALRVMHVATTPEAALGRKE